MSTPDISQPPQKRDLEAHFRQKYESNGPAGPSPSRRKAYGYTTPADHYEISVKKLVNQHTKWLDVGAGKSPFPDNPKLAEELSKKAMRFFGIDPSENVKQNPYVQQHYCGKLEDYRSDERFDLITLRMVAEHVEDPVQLARELSDRILPGGIVVMLTVWKFAPVTVLANLLPFAWHHPVKKLFWGGDEADTFPTVYRMNTKRTLKKLFSDFGFNQSHVFLLGDCSVTSQLGNFNHVELFTWRACKSIGVSYPESCILGIFRKDCPAAIGESTRG